MRGMLFAFADHRRDYWITELYTGRQNVCHRHLYNTRGQRDNERRVRRAERHLGFWDWTLERLWGIG